MKKAMFCGLMITAAMLFSCESKEAKMTEDSSNNASKVTEDKQNTSGEDSSTKNNETWYVQEENLKDELMDMQDFNEDANFSDKVLYIQKENIDSDEYAFTLAEKVGDIIEPEIVCEGGGSDFATCVKDWLAEHEDRCLTIYSEDEEYFADDDCEK
ncbi:MAG: hypothetical protein ACQERC_04180 [Bacteroidota bacterium]